MKKIKKDDFVIVMTGKDKGKIGKVLLSLKGKICVSDVNVKSVKSRDSKNNSVQYVKKEYFIDVSNVLYWDNQDNVMSRIGFKYVDDQKVRYLKSSGKVLLN